MYALTFQGSNILGDLNVASLPGWPPLFSLRLLSILHGARTDDRKLVGPWPGRVRTSECGRQLSDLRGSSRRGEECQNI